jgi:hypothetical protein
LAQLSAGGTVGGINVKEVLKGLEREGIHLLEAEELGRVLDLKKGLSEELNTRRSALVLTNRRLLYWERQGPRIAVRSAFLGDVPRLDLVRIRRKWGYLIGGIVLIATGFAFWIGAREFLTILGPSTDIFGPLVRSFENLTVLGLLACVILGLGLIIYYFFSGKEELLMVFGGTEIEAPSPRRKAADVSVFINEFLKTKAEAHSPRQTTSL